MNATQSNFVSTGQYNNVFDEFGNLILVEGSEKYVAVVLSDEVFEQSSVSKIYNIDIEEFKDVAPVQNPRISSLESEKAVLQKKISDLTLQLSKVNPSEKEAIINASKDIIISLRIKAGEGNTPEDFNTSFPYLSLYSNDAKKSDASGINSSPTQQSNGGSGTSTSSTSTTVEQTTEVSNTESTSITSNLAVGDACPKQLDIQLVPPTNYKVQGPIPVLPTQVSNITIQPAVQSIPQPIHKVAVQAVVPVVTDSCVEKFYAYGKYNGVWESLGLPTSPLISTYGVYSPNVTESYSQESSDTLTYQVYLSEPGDYNLKFSADNSGYMEIDGVRMIDLSNVTSQSPYNTQVQAYLDDHAVVKNLTSGWKTVNLFYKNWGGPHSVAASISYKGRLIWTSRMAYNAKDYSECKGDAIVSPKFPCSNPSSIKVYSFDGPVDATLRITIKGKTVSYSNEANHGRLTKVSTFFNDGLDTIEPLLKLQNMNGRGSVNIFQQPSLSNDYTAIIDINDPQGGEGKYKFDIYQIRCPSTSEPLILVDSKETAQNVRPKQLSESAGGGCPAVWQLMETKELGVVEARHITVGMHLKDSVQGQWNRVNVAYIDVAPIYRIDIGGQVFDVDHSHKWYIGQDRWIKVTDIKPGDCVENTDGIKVRVNSVEYLRHDQYMHMNVDNERYVMGTNIIGHNADRFNARKF
jgi:hypothetical protein